uniref:G-protein coupled receptors family 3 profile domain-containing protein n=1 Tax=Leptobrachium leishanense TaxID=445787 RepID=A0A8C5N381_9ANUR
MWQRGGAGTPGREPRQTPLPPNQDTGCTWQRGGAGTPGRDPRQTTPFPTQPGSREPPLTTRLSLQLTRSYEDYKYYQDGDIVIGAVITVNSYAVTYTFKEEPLILCMGPSLRSYINFLVFLFGIEIMNYYPEVLPNITLGYHLYDSCTDTRKAVKSVLQILSGPNKTVPNYSCTGYNKVAGFIGDEHSITTIPIAQILGVYRYSQISYGATDYVLSDRHIYPQFFRMVQSVRIYYKVISRFIKYFGWNWVGIFVSNDGSGETELLILSQYLSSYGICVAFTIKFDTNKLNQPDVINRNINTVRSSSAQIIVICGAFNSAIIQFFNDAPSIFYERTLILNPSWTSNSYMLTGTVEALNKTITINLGDFDLPEYGSFFTNIRISARPQDKLLQDIGIAQYKCMTSNVSRNQFYSSVYNISLNNCAGRDRFQDLSSFVAMGVTPRVYYSIYIMVLALQNMHLYLKEQFNESNMKMYNYKTQLHHFIKEMPDIFNLNLTSFFNEDGEFVIENLIQQWLFLSKTIQKLYIGRYIDLASEDSNLFILPWKIQWRTKNNEAPRSQCSDNCLPGYRKVPREGTQSCCYNCAQCPEGEISYRNDSENCIKCPDTEWHNEKKDQCIPRLEEFLSYSDVITGVFSVLSALLFLITIGILVIFIIFKDTAIVKANNTSLSFLLLVSIMLTFPCVFLFLGRPVDTTCMLRQSTFSIIFSIAISCVLGKTTMIYIVFKATKPGSVWKKWVNMKISNAVVLTFSLIQILINITWLAASPPFQELDTRSFPGKIIVQCNEGSVMAFYSVLGYMGLLAAVSFIIAFLARTLPDSFNEAKYITFSMLVFCSVWIAMIPAYLSTKGKNMVVVEIFAILTSSAGLLACIFFPKCFLILFRPEMNTKAHLLGSKNKVIST